MSNSLVLFLSCQAIVDAMFSGPAALGGRNTALASSPNLKLYTFGGSKTSLLSQQTSFEDLDLPTNTWTVLTPPPIPAGPGSSLTWHTDGKLYLFGLDPGTQIPPGMGFFSQFDPVVNSWTSLSTISGGPSKRGYAGIASSGQKIYVFGGLDDSAVALGDFFCFNTSNQQWQAVSASGPAPSARFTPGMASTADGKIYVFGGGVTSTLLNDLYVFDPSGSTWTSLSASISGPVPSGRNNFAFAAGVDGRLYLFGGWLGAAFGNDFYSFDPTTKAWTSISSNPTTPSARCCSALTSTIDGKLFLFGGQTDAAIVSDVLQFSPATQNWIDCAAGDCSSYLKPKGGYQASRTISECRTPDALPAPAPPTACRIVSAGFAKLTLWLGSSSHTLCADDFSF